MAKKQTKKTVETLTHEEASRKNIPTAEYHSVMQKDDQDPIRVAYERRNRDLDPQLVWRGKDEQDWSDLVVHTPPLYIQEKLHPKVLIDDLLLRTETDEAAADSQVDLFADFNGVPDEGAKTEFYQHDANWTNRMILGDGLQVMASLAEREGLRGKVQCIYIDPPYGIKFNSNFQWSTTSRDVKDGNIEQITREPEQVKAFRDTWRNGIHSYLTYLRDRLTVARDLLHDSGSIFVQIGDENVHRVRALLDEVFGEDCQVAMIAFTKGATGLSASGRMPARLDYLLWYSRASATQVKYRQLYKIKDAEEDKNFPWVILPNGERIRRSKLEKLGVEIPADAKFGQDVSLTKPGPGAKYEVEYVGRNFDSGKRWWGTTKEQLERALKTDRIIVIGKSLRHLRYLDESSLTAIGNLWDGFLGQSSPVYVVQTNTEIVQRCILMTTDPGDLVIDPTCGSGTTAYVAEQWGRRWITMDTSRVALALARARIMGARYPYYLLTDSHEGQLKEANVTHSTPSESPTHESIRQGFVYERAPRVTLKSIANNSEIDIIWEQYQEKLEPLRNQLNQELGETWEEWEIPRDANDDWDDAAKKLHAEWWEQRIVRQKEIDASIAAKADFEYLYDKPYEDKKKVRVAGPFTVESLSPHRVLGVDENDELIDGVSEPQDGYGEERDFVRMIMENLKTAGVQQAHKEDKIDFISLTPWPGDLICAEGHYEESGSEKRAGIFIGPEFGTVSRPDLVFAAREAGDADFDVLISCAFNYDAHSSEFDKLGRIPVLKARMNADLHMAEDLKNTGKGNLFVIFGEPDIDIIDAKDGKIQVKVNGVDVFHPNTGEVRSDGAEGIACWFIDTDYNEESFFVRHAYFLGANDPYKALKTTLKAEINEDAWATLNSDTSRPFNKPTSGRIAVKVINHLGDEVMKVFRV
ncbi:site-specific DNA-methyltransferase [Sedimenticola selenatireducens]|uniref:site-specific DNA-methyltransferase n=1 Tax=Sedimenticola selenatireducens TaxID=191960 RepID=UPI000490136A|nr:site-specific DNA-methyltransferase [Sedimenticola selenatireducens]